MTRERWKRDVADAAVGIVVIIVVVIGVAACLSARAVLHRKLAGGELDDWEWCRKQLGHRGAMRVVRTTTRRRVLA